MNTFFSLWTEWKQRSSCEKW